LEKNDVDYRRWSSLCSAAAAVLVLAQPAVAQEQASSPEPPGATAEASSPEDSDDSSGRGVEEIVVTALRRSESAQEVPASIFAISSESLGEQGIAEMRDLSKVVPNLVWGEHFGTTVVTLRGTGSNVNSGVTEPTVALYIDGVFLPRSTMATLRAVDLERVEVLRGPQGTLYGRNATGGAINFISAAPSDEFEGRVELSAGSRDAWGVNAYVSGPITDGVYFRLSGGREEQDGYLKVLNTGQRLNGTAASFGRLAFRLEPTEAVSVDLSVRYERNTAAVAYQQLFTPNPIATPADFTTRPNRMLADYPFDGEKELLVAAGTVEWSISDTLTLKSTSAWVDHESHDAVDNDSSLVPFFFTDDFDRPSESFSQDISLTGSGDRLDWILGVYYFRENAELHLPIVFGGALGVPAGAEIDLTVFSKIRNFAIYGDATYSLLDNLRLNLGLRYNHESNRFTSSLGPAVRGADASELWAQIGQIPAQGRAAVRLDP
jgi:iron complex outermembrane receptor protein